MRTDFKGLCNLWSREHLFLYIIFILLGAVGGKEMNQTELPTLRDCFQYGIFLRETSMDYMNHTTHDTRALAKEILSEVRERWGRASAKFKPPVTAADVTIENRLVSLWDKASDIA